MKRVLLSLACLCTALGDSAGQVEGTSDPALDLKLQEEIQKLGDEEPARRLEARRTIQQMGARTIPGIKRALRDHAVDAEQRAALGEILEEIPRELEFAFEVKSTERCAFSPAGGKLAIYDTEGNLVLLDSRTGRQLRKQLLKWPRKDPNRNLGPGRWNTATPCFTDENMVFIQIGWDRLTPVPVGAREPRTAVIGLKPWKSDESSLQVVPLGEDLVAALHSSSIDVHSSRRRIFTRPEDGLIGIAGSARKDCIVFADRNQLSFLSIRLGELEAKPRRFNGVATALAAPADLSRLYVSLQDGSIEEHLPENFAVKARWLPDRVWGELLAVSPDGRFLAYSNHLKVGLLQPKSWTPWDVFRPADETWTSYITVSNLGFVAISDGHRIRVYRPVDPPEAP